MRTAMDLDDLLTRAAPQLAARDQMLDDELRALVRAAGPAGRRRRRLAVVGVVTTAVLGVGVAGATGAVPLPGGWLHTSSGSDCRVEFFAEAATVVDGRSYTPDQTAPAVAAARSWLTELDLDSVDRAAAVREWRAAEARARESEPPGERQPELRGDDLETTAVHYAVGQRLAAYLRSRGLDPDAVIFATGTRCD
jgi:hypothetical protein